MYEVNERDCSDIASISYKYNDEYAMISPKHMPLLRMYLQYSDYSAEQITTVATHTCLLNIVHISDISD